MTSSIQLHQSEILSVFVFFALLCEGCVCVYTGPPHGNGAHSFMSSSQTATFQHAHMFIQLWPQCGAIICVFISYCSWFPSFLIHCLLSSAPLSCSCLLSSFSSPSNHLFIPHLPLSFISLHSISTLHTDTAA